jgi:hypothetical protein
MKFNDNQIYVIIRSWPDSSIVRLAIIEEIDEEFYYYLNNECRHVLIIEECGHVYKCALCNKIV